MSSLIQIIDENECIGDSLAKINTNAENLDTAVQTLSTFVQGLSTSVIVTDTNTIDLTRTEVGGAIQLQADVKSQSITTSTIAPEAITTITIANSAVTAEKMSGGQTGSAPVYGCRAWVNFDGTTVNGLNECLIRDSGNVSKVVRNDTGDYTITFITTMPTANYAVLVTGDAIIDFPTNGRTTSTCRFSQYKRDDILTRNDGVFMHVAIFG